MNIGCYTSPTAPQFAGAAKEAITIEAEQVEEAAVDWLTIQEVAELRNVSYQAIHRAVKEGRLPSKEVYKSKGGIQHYMIRRDVALAWDEHVARYGRGARKRKIPKPDKPARRELVLVSP